MVYFSQLVSAEELLTLTKTYHAGIELVDFSVGMNLDQLTDQLKKWEKILEDLGNPPVNIHGPFLDLNPMSFERLTAEASWIRFSQAFEAARCLNAERIIFHTCRVPMVCYQEGWAQRLSDFWNRFLEQHRRVPVSIENVFDENPEIIADFASQVKAENFSLCFDIGHANHASDISVEEWMEILSPWIEHLHLHDNHGVTDEHLPLGWGGIDLKNAFKKIKMLPNLKSVTLENTSADDFSQSVLYLKKHAPWLLAL